ncbi:ABC transporter substrate-binding protein [Cryptosporangium aurantiacum]|uniref:ABC-type branched-chain amino acid transport system, substrate-binding protein n=1 Tax=Cryptosporangium aurantiacum TaxID=134849 RepID=A0A1M7RQ14_9ACTN|nr:ABC transporter substrate-binding protein [Cryptosporangium aurantiacum]SHN48172.1 ABC-type branched-chain amino acid transport system, substrate-binding protein [Cryptosporangium aurantiacum]
MRRQALLAAGTAFVLALAVTACGEETSQGSDEITLGVLAPLSGPLSSAFAAYPGGVEARLAAYKEDGGKCADKTFTLVKADDQSSPQGALTASQKLVQQDKVYAIVEGSPVFYGAAPFMTTIGKKVPVSGGGFDGAKQWTDTTNNLLPASIVPEYDKTFATHGEYFKSLGGTKIAGVAYDNPAGKGGLDYALRSADAAGLQRGYVNSTVPAGSTDVGAIVLGIIESKADVLTLTVNPDTGFAIVAGLRQAGYPLKGILSSTGYGADLLKSGPAVQAGQGVSFSTGWAPVELKTPGALRLSKALKDHAGSESGIPSFAQSLGWLTTDLLLHGLDLAGCDATQEKLLSTIRNDKTWTADGLFALPRDFTTTSADKLCLYFLKLTGQAFVPEPKASPLCGSLVSK